MTTESEMKRIAHELYEATKWDQNIVSIGIALISSYNKEVGIMIYLRENKGTYPESYQGIKVKTFVIGEIVLQ